MELRNKFNATNKGAGQNEDRFSLPQLRPGINPFLAAEKNFDRNEFREFWQCSVSEYFHQTLPVSFHNRVSVYQTLSEFFIVFFNLIVLCQVNVLICFNK